MDVIAAKIAQKISLLFAKTGAAIYLSHLDLMRHFSRMLRRANLRPRLTAGFNPRPRLVFPHALPLGVSSDCETVEIEFSEIYPLAEIFTALKTADRGVLELRRIESLPPAKAGKIVERCAYEIREFDADTVEARRAVGESLLAAETLRVTRGVEAKRREIDIRPYLESLAVEENSLTLILRHTESGAGRIDDFAKIFAARLAETSRIYDWRAWLLRKTAMFFKA